MSYAQLGGEVFERQAELLCEEYRLYTIVFYHSYPDKHGRRVCRMEIEELCRIYELDYGNATRRIKRLRTGKFSKGEKPKHVKPMKSAWLFQDKKKHLYPLVGLSKTVKFTEFYLEKTVIFTVLEAHKTVNITVPDCNIYSKTPPETVNITVPLKEVKKPFKEAKKQNSLRDKKNERENKNSNGHKSKFSETECLRYVEILIRKGASIGNAQAYAMKLYKEGDSDVFISAELYPEADEPELVYEPDTGEKLIDGLQILREVRSEGKNWKEFKKWYSDEEWQWLKAEMAK